MQLGADGLSSPTGRLTVDPARAATMQADAARVFERLIVPGLLPATQAPIAIAALRGSGRSPVISYREGRHRRLRSRVREPRSSRPQKRARRGGDRRGV